MASTGRRRGRVPGGTAAGLVAGLAMLLAAAIGSAAEGLGVGLPARLVAATWYGVPALVGGPLVIAVGIATHLAGAALLGIAFAGLGRGRRARTAAGYGLVFGVAVWAVMTHVVLPLVNPVMRDRVVGLTPGWWLVQHLVFGGALFLTPLLRRALGRRAAGRLAGRLRQAA